MAIGSFTVFLSLGAILVTVFDKEFWKTFSKVKAKTSAFLFTA